MSEVQIQCGERSTHLKFDVNRPVEVVTSRRAPVDLDSLSRSISKPIASADLASFVAGKMKILVVVNDHTRPTPTAAVLGFLPLSGKEVTTIVATGTHRSPTPDEVARLLGGPSPQFGGKVAVHDAKNHKHLRYVGETSRGTKLSLNSAIFDADGIIVVGSVEPHYFAGFTGGRKFLLPALAGFESVTMNHSLAVDEGAKVLALDGNPVHEDFMEALNMLGRNDDVFSIQTVLNADHQVSYTSSGHIINSFTAAVEHAKEIYVSPVSEKADIVVSVIKPPMDLDLYQSQKGIDNVKLALNDGGVLILVSSCRDGIGDRGFYTILTSGEGVSKERASEYGFGFHKAVKLREILSRVKVFAVTDLPPKILEAISITPYNDLEKALNEATRLKGDRSRVLIVRDAGLVVPLPNVS